MSAAGKFVSHTSGTRTVDGASGQNNKMERGGSVSANPIWEPAAPNSPKERLSSPKYANQTGGYGEVGVRDTPMNQHGTTGKVEPASPQPDLKGHNAAPHTKRP
jgi:hypothetical protein